MGQVIGFEWFADVGGYYIKYKKFESNTMNY